jgi:hypothetical protein
MRRVWEICGWMTRHSEGGRWAEREPTGPRRPWMRPALRAPRIPLRTPAVTATDRGVAGAGTGGGHQAAQASAMPLGRRPCRPGAAALATATSSGGLERHWP